jgi:hypothetical protein
MKCPFSAQKLPVHQSRCSTCPACLSLSTLDDDPYECRLRSRSRLMRHFRVLTCQLEHLNRDIPFNTELREP